MTRKSPRELERALEAVREERDETDAMSAREWVDWALVESIRTGGWSPTYDGPDDPDMVCIEKRGSYTWYAPRDEIPDEIADELPLTNE